MRYNIFKKYIPRPAKRIIKLAVGSTPISTSESDAPKPKSLENVQPDYGENTVINHPELEKSRIVFKGKNNVLYCEPGVILSESIIEFNRDNSVIYLSSGPVTKYNNVFFMVSNDSVIYVGKDVSFNKSKNFRSRIMAFEQKNVVIGSDCLFALNCWIRTSDSHPIYDSMTDKRLNPAKSVLVGDHVWVGQNVTILKGSCIGSGAVIGANSLVTGKKLASNTSYAGSPARAIKAGIYFDKQDVNHATEIVDTFKAKDTKKYVYSDSAGALNLEDIDDGLSAAKTSKAKLAYIKKHLAKNTAKNRFYMGTEK